MTTYWLLVWSWRHCERNGTTPCGNATAQLQAADKEALLVSERAETTQLRDKIGSLERAEAARKAAEALRAMEDSVRAAAAPPPPDLDAIYDAHAADLASSLASLRLSLQAEFRKEAERAALSARNELTRSKTSTPSPRSATTRP